MVVIVRNEPLSTMHVLRVYQVVQYKLFKTIPPGRARTQVDELAFSWTHPSALSQSVTAAAFLMAAAIF